MLFLCIQSDGANVHGYRGLLAVENQLTGSVVRLRNSQHTVLVLLGSCSSRRGPPPVWAEQLT